MTVPRWALASAIAAPVAMIGGWTLAAARQPSFDPVQETISALAASTATEPWIMTAGLAITGVAHVVTAAGLRPVPRRARVLHAIGGAATLAVALLPVDAAPRAHGIAAGIGFGALALWPALAGRRGATGILRPVVTVGASVGLVGLLGWFVVELQGGGDLTGLTERAVAGAQAVWPLVVVVALRRQTSRSTSTSNAWSHPS
ncbi:DUF998 domain-containing protein [Cellulomonas humilata]|uniref:DUF998 domain-containing protein n=1 Tax=Cellulomonas humilata TaxID=144055 RepID=A0A7Y6A2L4_9CELL|nr:DUF998 domain-containing protein [Cellulomonas humilata]NUU18567.1 DUF998 domain-containing protein [Cellulomonas humilata]